MSHRITHVTRQNNPVDVSLFQISGNEDSKQSLCFISRRCLNLIRGVHEPRRLKFVQWRLLFVGPRYETCLSVIIWRLEFWVSPCSFFGKVVHHLLTSHAIDDKLLSNESERILKWS